MRSFVKKLAVSFLSAALLVTSGTTVLGEEDSEEDSSLQEQTDSYTVSAVYKHDTEETRKVLELTDESTPVSVYAEEFDGYEWDGRAVVLKKDGTFDVITEIFNNGYKKENSDDEVNTVLFSEVSDSNEIDVVFEYNAKATDQSSKRKSNNDLRSSSVDYFKVDIEFYNYNSFNDDKTKTETAALVPGGELALSGTYYVFVTVKDSSNSLIGYSYQTIANQEYSDSWVSKQFNTFTSLTEGELDWQGNPTYIEGESFNYNPDYSYSVRIKKGNGWECNYSQIVGLSDFIEASEPGDAYEFIKNNQIKDGEDGPVIGSLIWIQRTYPTELEVKISYSPEQISFDNTYLLTEITHSQSDKTYSIKPFTTPSENISIINDFSEWYGTDGSIKTNEKYTGNEADIHFYVIHSVGDLDKSEIAKGNTSKYTETSVGDILQEYKLIEVTSTPTVETDEINKKKKHTYQLTFEKQNYSYDYNFKKILGPGINYGITADTLNHKNDLETNFSVRNYIGRDGQGVNPDLSGTSTGTLVIGKIEEESKLKVSYNQGKVPLIYSQTTDYLTEDSVGKVDPTQKTEQEINETIVDPIISYATNISSELAQKAINATPVIIKNNTGERVAAKLDTTAYPDNATIYIDADSISDITAMTGDGSTRGLIINKKTNQTIVFTFDNTKEVKIGKYYVNGIETTTDNQHQSDHNSEVDSIITRKIVWNCTGTAETVKLGNTAGIFLAPNADVNIADPDVGSSCAGWIITGKTATNLTGEWHFVYKDLEQENEIDAKKTLTGATLEDNQFEFRAIPDSNNPTEGIDTLDFATDISNIGNDVYFGPLRFSEEGVWKYLIKEVEKSVTGIVFDRSEYEVVFNVTKKEDDSLNVEKTINKIKDSSGANISPAQEVDEIAFANSHKNFIKNAEVKYSRP